MVFIVGSVGMGVAVEVVVVMDTVVGVVVVVDIVVVDVMLVVVDVDVDVEVDVDGACVVVSPVHVILRLSLLFANVSSCSVADMASKCVARQSDSVPSTEFASTR